MTMPLANFDSYQGADLTDFPLKIMGLAGIRLSENSIFWMVLSAVTIALDTLILCLSAIGIVDETKKHNWKLVMMLMGNSFFPFIHVLSKYLIMHLNKHLLVQLLSKRTNFWPPPQKDQPGDSSRRTVHKARILIRTCIWSALCTSFLDIVEPFFTGKLSLYTYVPPGWFHVLRIVWMVPVVSGSVSVTTPDALMCALTVPVVLQFRLVSKQFGEELTGNAGKFAKQKLRRLVDHQQYLLDYCDGINEYYRIIFLVQILVTTFAAFGVFMAFKNETSLMNMWTWIFYFLLTTVETGIYCYSAEQLSNGAQEVGYSLYDSYWENYDVTDIKKDILMVIQRSQKGVTFSGFGYVTMNMSTFTKVFKGTLSFFTFMNKITQK